jgi:hypothetical protein
MATRAVGKPTPSHSGLLALAAALGRQAAREDHAARKVAAEQKPDNNGDDRHD